MLDQLMSMLDIEPALACIDVGDECITCCHDRGRGCCTWRGGLDLACSRK